MIAWVITVENRINSVWSSEAAANKHVARLIEVNGDQIAVRLQGIEVRQS